MSVDRGDDYALDMLAVTAQSRKFLQLFLETIMSVYRVTDLIGTSPTSWEEAAKEALTTAAGSLRELRIAEVVAQDITLSDDGKIESYRTKLRVSFKYDKS